MIAPCLYSGTVTHHRLRPRAHRLAYRIYSMLLDLDRLEEFDARLRWFSVDRFNLFSFHRRDRGDGSGSPLRAQVEDAMRAAGVEPDGGRIFLLTMPRLLGWAFNPISVYYCCRQPARPRRHALGGRQHVRRAPRLYDPGREARARTKSANPAPRISSSRPS